MTIETPRMIAKRMYPALARTFAASAEAGLPLRLPLVTRRAIAAMIADRMTQMMCRTRKLSSKLEFSLFYGFR
jgi:hypothetical protein